MKKIQYLMILAIGLFIAALLTQPAHATESTLQSNCVKTANLAVVIAEQRDKGTPRYELDAMMEADPAIKKGARIVIHSLMVTIYAATNLTPAEVGDAAYDGCMKQ